MTFFFFYLGNQQNLQYHYNSPLSNSLSCQGIVSIDPETGWISVQRQFDYDNPADRRFVFDVFAKNILPSDRCSGQNTKESQAQSSGLSSGADSNPTIQICVTEHRVPVIIEVLDRNDNAVRIHGSIRLSYYYFYNFSHNLTISHILLKLWKMLNQVQQYSI